MNQDKDQTDTCIDQGNNSHPRYKLRKPVREKAGQPSSQGPKRNQQFPHSSFGFMQFVQDSLAEPMTCKYAQQKDPRYEKKHTDRTFQHSRCQNRYKDCSSV